MSDPADSLSRRTATGAAWMVAWRMGARVIGLASTLVLARVLAPADFGLVAMAMVFAGAIDSLSQFGLAEALIRREEHDENLLNAAFSIQFIRGLATALIIAGVAWPASVWFNEPRLFYMLLPLAAGSILSGLENIGIVEFRRNIRFDMEFRLLVTPRILQVLVTILLAFTLQSYWALIGGIVFGKLARLVMTYSFHPYRPRFSLTGWRELMGFSFWTWLGGLVTMVWERADSFVIGPVVGASVLGIYLLGVEIAILPVTELIAPATAALFAGIARARSRDSGISDRALPLISLVLLLVAPLAITLSATSGYVVNVLLGAQWKAAQPLISIFAMISIFAPFSYVCTTILLAEGRVRQNFQVVAISAAMKVALLTGMTTVTHRPELIAAASVCSNIFECIFFLIQSRRIGPLGWSAAKGGMLRTLLATMVTAAALYLTGLGWQPPGTDHIVLNIIMGALIGSGAMGLALLLQFGLWRLGGSPPGAEERALGLWTEMRGRRTK
ncbi:oligosaccharide flippase family protein [Sphingomonas sp. SRS2]|uniref:oligosaccharide flippase family protein n=1 Tax=Sphingomonas sp. SRS2 TaxID=133190 RepID=UPI00061846FC|nr:oligosaccharide flippase family protein [Sphingomonas sp. SRS2]KKC26058.1 hypothetical protein WP12_10625 [Sphingomonas sp. SRS2]